jgi:Protein of unknown function (DUF2971)
MTNSLRKKYYDNVSGIAESPNDLQKLKLEILKGENDGAKLYKYCGIDTGHKILTSNTILLQPPDNFNDPFDCLSRVGVWDEATRFGPIAEELDFVRAKIAELPSKYQPKKFTLFNDLRTAYRYAITCFSSNSLSHLMWSHYANNHRGICLEFKISDVLGSTHPCFYTHEMPDFDPQSRNLGSALVKGHEWHYEKEWRYLKETIRLKMRLLSSALHQIYNEIHTNSIFGKDEYQEWSSINSAIIKDMEDIYEAENRLRITPTKIILGASFSRNYSNQNHELTCREIIRLARKNKIPVFRIQTSAKSFDLQQIEVAEREPSWLDLNPDLRETLPTSITDET